MSTIRLRRKIRSRAWLMAFFAVAFTTVLNPSSALALTAGNGITFTDGSIAVDQSYAHSLNTSGTAAGLSATLAVASGGTNLTSASDDNVMLGNGTTWQSKALSDCPSGGISYNASTNAFGCTSVGSALNPTLTFNSETKLATGSATVYMGAGGRLSATEADVLMPVGAHRFKNLRVYSSGTTGGSGIAVSVGTGACTGGLTYTSTPTATTTSTTQVADTSNSVTTTAGQCIALKLVRSSTTTATFVNASIEYDT